MCVYISCTGVSSRTRSGYSGDGSAATAALLNNPVGVVLDTSANIYIADKSNNVIRKVTPSTGAIRTFAGTNQNEWTQTLL